MICIETVNLLIFLGIIAWTDLKRRIIPNRILVILLTLKGLEYLYAGNAQVIRGVEGFLLGGGILLMFYLLTGGIGAGDVKLFAVLGWVLGRIVWKVIFAAFLLAAVIGGIFFLMGRLEKKQSIPMAPFALLGVLMLQSLGMI